MAFTSDDKIIEKAFNLHWLYVYVPVAILFLIESGVFLHYIESRKADFSIFYWGVPLICASVFIWHLFINRLWFSIFLKKVDDKKQFFERSVRNKMIRKWNAINIISCTGYELKEVSSKENLPSVTITNNTVLTNDALLINEKKYLWNEIEDFRVTVGRKYGALALQLLLKDGSVKLYSLPGLSSFQETESYFDRYLRNYKRKKRYSRSLNLKW